MSWDAILYTALTIMHVAISIYFAWFMAHKFSRSRFARAWRDRGWTVFAVLVFILNADTLLTDLTHAYAFLTGEYIPRNIGIVFWLLILAGSLFVGVWLQRLRTLRRIR